MTKLFIYVGILLLGGILTLVYGFTHRQHSNADADRMYPSGDWSITATPSWRAGYEQNPIDVASVTSTSDKQFSIVRVQLRNTTAGRVKSIELSWQLFDEKRPHTIVEDGGTGAIDVDIPPGGSYTLERKIVKFSSIVAPLLDGERLTGNYRIEVLPALVRFDGGKTWVMAEQKNPTTTDNAQASNNSVGQRCRYRDGYQVEASPNAETCSINGLEATVTRSH